MVKKGRIGQDLQNLLLFYLKMFQEIVKHLAQHYQIVEGGRKKERKNIIG